MVVHSAGIQDTRGARLLMLRMHRAFGLRKIFVDAGYKSRCLAWAAAMFGWALEVVRRTDRRFTVVPKRWIVLRRTMLPVSVSRGRRWSTGGSWPVLGGMGSARLS